jgi:FkbH-like protein
MEQRWFALFSLVLEGSSRMKRNMSHRRLMALQTAAALCYFCYTPLYATTTLGFIFYFLLEVLGLGQWLTWVGWVILSPIIYVTWLNAFLIACDLDIQAWRVLFNFKKHRRISTNGGFDEWVQCHLQLVSYMRERIVWHLPLTQTYLGIEGLRLLVLWAGAPSAHVGRGSYLFGLLYDPDLTEIGEDAILGSDSFIVAHAVTNNLDGSRVFATAPVKIGARTVIGGGCRIDMGVRIGADSIVEPMSFVAPFTRIGDREVWGGNPARFIRHRFEESTLTTAASASLPAEVTIDDESLRQVVAAALDLPLSDVTADYSCSLCPAWDSLGQMAIAAGLHDRFGITVPAETVFRLKSMDDLRQFLGATPNSGSSNGSADGFTLPNDPELLPLLDHEHVTRALAVRESKSITIAREPVSVVVAATFVAEPVANSLKVWSGAFGIPVNVQFAGFNQVQQCLMTPGSEFHQNASGLNVVLARPEDLLSNNDAGSLDAAESLLSAIASFAKSAPGTLVVGTLPPVVSSFFTSDRKAAETLRTLWRNRLAEIEGIRTLDFDEIVEQIGISAAGRADLEVIARSPYTPRGYQELGIAIARVVRQQRVAPAKVIALDADGVLWGGVLGEDGLTGIHLSGDYPGRGFQLFQKQVLELKRRGCLLVIVSRNEEEDVWRVFDEHPEMILKREDITAARINWRPKSENLRELAAELNLGLDAFVFIDDDPANRAEVGANAPGVTVLPLPTDASLYCRTLSQLWRFDTPHITTEDQNRAAMMQAEQQRQQHQSTTTDLASYLRSLQLRAEMRLASPAELPRVAQLTQKTNQFNSTLKRRSLSEIQALTATHSIFVIEASDRFGDYGLIGVAILTRNVAHPHESIVDTFLMSCRALGRGIEDAVLHGLLNFVAADGGQRLIIPTIEGPRNQPCLEFLKRAIPTQRAGGEFELDAIAGHALPEHIAWDGPARLVSRKAA